MVSVHETCNIPRKSYHNLEPILYNKKGTLTNYGVIENADIEGEENRLMLGFAPNGNDFNEDYQEFYDLKRKKKEEDYLKNNFYYFNFVQLNSLMNLINTVQYKNYTHGSSRLIGQFLYITRFLREFTEIEYGSSNSKINKKEIVNYCFLDMFDLKWIEKKYILNEEYSCLIRSQLINLLNTYLEEMSEEGQKKFFEKIDQNMNYNIIVGEMNDCLIEILKIIKKKNDGIDEYFSNIKFEYIFYNYINNDNLIYKNKYFELAEFYYKLLRLINPFYEAYREHYKDHIGHQNKKNYFKFDIFKSDKNDVNKKNIENREAVLFKFIDVIAKEVEIKFIESNKKAYYRKIYFFKSSKCFWANKAQNSKFLETTPRGNLNEKLDYFNKHLDKFLFNINVSYKYRYQKSMLWSNYLKQPTFLNLDIINFLLSVITNILLLTYYYNNSSDIMYASDLNSHLLLNNNASVYGLKQNYILYTTIAFTFLQFIILFIWIYFRYSVNVILNGYEKIPNKKYLINDYKTEIQFKSESFKSYIDMVEIYNDLDSKYLKMDSFDIQSFIMITYLRLQTLFWNKEIFYTVLNIVLNILYFITNYKLLLVIPIMSVVNLYSLFNYFYQAMISKYQQFVALLFFIYIVEYIFSWITFLHFPELMINEYVDRSGNYNDNVIILLFINFIF